MVAVLQIPCMKSALIIPLCCALPGLKVIAQKFPEGMTTGSIPTSCFSSPTSSKGKKSSVPRQPSQAAEKRWRFTSDELTKLQEHLEEILIPSNSSSKSTLSETQNSIFQFKIRALF